MKPITKWLAVGAAGALLAACSASNAAPPAPSQITNPGAPGYANLEFNVGYLTIANPGGGPATGLNVVSALRQKSGSSPVLENTPTLTGAFTLTGYTMTAGTAGTPGGSPILADSYATAEGATPSGATTGAPSALDAGLNQLSGTPQTLHAGAPPCDTLSNPAPSGYASCAGTGETTPSDTTFGTSGGVFANGLQPGNYTENSIPSSLQPYAYPLFASATGESFMPYGGPPAFDPDGNGMGTRDGLYSNAGSINPGVITGLTAFQVPTAAGAYSLSTTIVPAGGSATVLGPVASTLNGAPLGTLTAPTVTLDGNGGASITVPAFPAGVTEEWVEIADWGPGGAPGSPAANCQGTYGPATGQAVYYTMVFTAAGTYPASATTLTGGAINVGLPDLEGPNTTQGGPSTLTPSMSICTGAANTTALGATSAGDTYTVVGVGLSFDLYGANYPRNNSQNPNLGPAGGANATMSVINTGTST